MGPSGVSLPPRHSPPKPLITGHRNLRRCHCSFRTQSPAALPLFSPDRIRARVAAQRGRVRRRPSNSQATAVEQEARRAGAGGATWPRGLPYANGGGRGGARWVNLGFLCPPWGADDGTHLQFPSPWQRPDHATSSLWNCSYLIYLFNYSSRPIFSPALCQNIGNKAITIPNGRMINSSNYAHQPSKPS